MKEHDIVGTVICADPWPNSKLLFILRNGIEEGEEYWPNTWNYLTEHREGNESDITTISRCIKEELGLVPNFLYILKGPAHVTSVEPNHPDEIFNIALYQVMITNLQERMEVSPILNDENKRWTWFSQVGNPYDTLEIKASNAPIFPDLKDHLEALKMVEQNLRIYSKSLELTS